MPHGATWDRWDAKRVQSYIRYLVSITSRDPDQVFETNAYEAVYRAVDGVPRLINQVCDHSLILAGMSESRAISAALIEEA